MTWLKSVNPSHPSFRVDFKLRLCWFEIQIPASFHRRSTNSLQDFRSFVSEWTCSLFYPQSQFLFMQLSRPNQIAQADAFKYSTLNTESEGLGIGHYQCRCSMQLPHHVSNCVKVWLFQFVKSRGNLCYWKFLVVICLDYALNPIFWSYFYSINPCFKILIFCCFIASEY